ncbi:adenylate/guanylate cyclase domain-containing protein [Parachlamydia sp. AcF125]|uniref:adenylate/guanylate cyclase domain-containing protein n=1 Tax=Parachlamydia sp. AcF125 TaxID=2795736 RepID=UPI001BC9D4F1|nr:adenylate/guanylate cyclase domain-containing protein [Parachlamydia sp. AcF125]MBS4168698.1 Adenylate cyclase [Parachlamydia sp. AcF125]
MNDELNSKTILVVDDTPLQAIMLRRILIQTNYNVLTVKNGAEALEFLKKQKFDLVITDVNMPVMDGFKLCHFIKTDPVLKSIPVIICTILSAPEDLIKGIEAGADNYITKPWNNDLLLLRVKECLGRTYQPQIFSPTEEIIFGNKTYNISTSRQYILNFLLSTYEHIHQQNLELQELKEEIQHKNSELNQAQKEQEQMMFNVFPPPVAQELLAYGSVNPRRVENATVGFVDFSGFTESSSKLDPPLLLEVLEFYFENFDRIMESRQIERIKTIGDGYMFASGVLEPRDSSAFDCVRAALDIREFMKKAEPFIQQKYQLEWKARMGIHSGPLIAGVIGKQKLAYDIWGDTVNIANHLQAQSEESKINISQETYERIKDIFRCTYRGKLPIQTRKKTTGILMDMYFVEEIHQK